MSEFKYMITNVIAKIMLVCFTIAYFYTDEFDYLILAFCALIYSEIIELKYKK